MKSTLEVSPVVPAFEPFTLTIKVETLEEAKVLRGLWNYSAQIAGIFRNYGTPQERSVADSTHSLLVATFHPVHLHLQDRGLLK